MNSLGWLMISSAAHATAFAVIGSLAYLVVRHRSPAAGALTAAASIVIMGLVSLAVMVPLPGRWTITLGEQAHVPVAIPKSANGGDQATDDLVAGHSSSAERGVVTPSSLVHDRSDEAPVTSVWINAFLNELRQPTAAVKRWQGPWLNGIALGFLASAGFGLARLAIGVWSIRRLRARSRPIDDREMIDVVELLRAELSCLKRVEVRECADLTTPATIGSNQPFLLLPGDWRSWSEQERRAALAHELAHICRHDFLTGLVAQLSLCLQFYNPIAHWLSARLRLEQELAADAWGACIAGGNQQYLTALAHMALRRDSPAVSWAASAFLPSRATFVRRIEMLRNSTRVRHAPLSAIARQLTIGGLIFAGLLLTGVRMPATPAPAQADEQIARDSKAAVPPSYNLSFLPADTKMIVALQPQALLEHAELRRLFEPGNQAPAFQGLPLSPNDIAQLIVFWDAASEAPSVPNRNSAWPFAAGGIIRTSKAQDWTAVAKSGHLGPIRQGRHDGQVFFSFQQRGPEDWGAFAPDDRTLVVARENVLRDLIEDRNIPASAHTWDEAWNKAKKGQMMLAVEARWLRKRLVQAMRGGASAPAEPGSAEAKLQTISPLLDKAHAYALAIDLSPALAVDLVALATSDENAKPVADTAQALLTLAANAVHGLRRELRGPNEAREAMDLLIGAASSLLNDARLETSGRQVHMQAKASVDLGAGLKLLEPAVTAARAAATRAQSVNNLKQIGLAFHTHHAAKDCFPAAVMYGGKSGKVPYSWRVALLPYLDQNELYQKYNFDEPWDGPNNRKLLELMPAVYGYANPIGSSSAGPNTAYFVFTGEGTALGTSANAIGSAGGSMVGVGAPAGSSPPNRQPGQPKSPGPNLMDITDGTSNTILAVEANRRIPWTKPEDIPFDLNSPVPELGGFGRNGFNSLFADGSVRFISKNVNPGVLKALITRAGNEVVQPGDPSGTAQPRKR